MIYKFKKSYFLTCYKLVTQQQIMIFNKITKDAFVNKIKF